MSRRRRWDKQPFLSFIRFYLGDKCALCNLFTALFFKSREKSTFPGINMELQGGCKVKIERLS